MPLVLWPSVAKGFTLGYVLKTRIAGAKIGQSKRETGHEGNAAGKENSREL